MVNVALYGGSFDPPTIGHVMVVSHLLLNDESVQKVVVMPCYEHLEKKGLTGYAYRVRMCQEAFGWLPRTEVSRLEETLGGGSLTVRTVRAMKASNPDWRIFFVMGSDLMAHAAEWEGWDELLQEATPLIVGRAGMPSYTPSSINPTPICPIVSSTIVRDLLARQDYDKADRYIPRAVLETIKSCELYR